MKHVSILIPKGHCSLVNVAGSHQILGWVNEFMLQTGRQPLFDLHLVGLSKTTKQTNGLFTISADLTIHDVDQTDLIILPAIHGDLDENLKMNRSLIPWLVTQYAKGAEIVSLCIGSFFLASTGILDGKECSTHWHFANDFRKMFPAIKLADEKIVTDSDGIYTSGGAYAFTNMILYLIEKFAGRDIAIQASKAFMIDIEKTSQSPFMMFAGQKSHQDEAILAAQEFIEENYSEKITIDELCQKYGVGRRTFERRFKKATTNTVVEYIQKVKIEAAKKQLESGRKTVNEVMYEVGYSDNKAFRQVFKKITGVPPAKYMEKYRSVGVG